MRSCFFFHNPKAGGTALREALARCFDASEVSPTVDFLPDVYGFEPEPGLQPGYRLYMGHYGYDHFRAVEDGHACVTNFRHPASRIASLYNYFRFSVGDAPEVRERPEYFAVRLAKSADFAGFVASDDPRVTTYTSNHHFRQLANSGWSLSHQRRLDDVRRLIDQMAWYYVCEYPELSARWARTALDLPDLMIEAANVTPRTGEPGADLARIAPETLGRIMSLNELDLAIYRHALDRFFQETARDGQA